MPNRTKSGVGIVAAYRSLQDVAPASAYLFAQSLSELSLMVEASDFGVGQKITNMSDRIDQLSRASGVSSRLSCAAIWLVRHLVTAQLNGPGSGVGYRMSYDEIAGQQLTYRELTPLDHIEPQKPICINHLVRSGHRTLAQSVQEVEERFAQLADTRGADIDRLIDACRQACWRKIAAYDALSDRMKTYLDGLVAVHDGGPNYRKRAAVEGRDDKREFPRAEHPVIRTHPETGRKAIYVNPVFTVAIRGLPDDEGDAILRYLYEHNNRPQFQCRFKWRNDSIAFWDNRCVQHIAMWDYFPQVRSGNRVTVKGDRPYA